MTTKIDSTLSALTPEGMRVLRNMILDAMAGQPPHDSPAFNGPMAYELAVLNWDISNDITGHVHGFDEWWLTRNTEIV